MKILISHHIMWWLIWVCTVCLWPLKGVPGKNELKVSGQQWSHWLECLNEEQACLRHKCLRIPICLSKDCPNKIWTYHQTYFCVAGYKTVLGWMGTFPGKATLFFFISATLEMWTNSKRKYLLSVEQILFSKRWAYFRRTMSSRVANRTHKNCLPL